jgi:hypothetical protein
MKVKVVYSVKYIRLVANVLERRGMYKVSVGVLKGKKPPERHKSGWENNIELDFQEIKLRPVLNLSGPG